MKKPRVLLVALALVALCLAQTPFPPRYPIVPGFAMRPYPVRVGDTVRFTDYSKGPIVSWLWEFGDGATSTEQNPVHVYAEPGDYEIALTISDGSVTATARLGGGN